jgi:signal transduction histidine kinase
LKEINFENVKGEVLLILILLIGLISIRPVHSQTEIDSLMNEIESMEDDTNKVNQLVRLAKLTILHDPENSIKYSDRIYFLSKKLNFLPGIADYYFIKSGFHYNNSNYDSALYYIYKSQEIELPSRDLRREADYSRFTGVIIRDKGYSISAMEYFKKSLQLYHAAGDIEGTVKTYNSIGILYFNSAQYDSAAFYYIRGIELSETLHKGVGHESMLINLGKVYLYLNEFDKATEYFNLSLELSQKNNLTKWVALSYNDLGLVNMSVKNYDKAMDFYQLSLENYKNIDDRNGMAYTYQNIGSVFNLKLNYPEALNYYNKAFKLFQDNNFIEGILDAKVNIAVVYERKGNYSRALQIYDTCLSVALENGLTNNLPLIYNNIYKTHELAGDFVQAFSYQSKYYTLKDSLFNIEKAIVINDLEYKYKKEKQEVKILALKNENIRKDLMIRKKTNERNLILAGLFLLFTVGAITYYFLRQRTKKDKIIAEQKIKQLEDEKRLMAAQGVVEGQEAERKRIARDLHDGLGVLLSSAKIQFSNIADKVTENRDIFDSATRLIEKAAIDVRKISHNMMPGLLTKYGLIEALESLFDQFEGNSEISGHLEVNGDVVRLPENSEIMVYRVIQEMINNTLKHANAKFISLNLNFSAQLLNIQYSDNGAGFNVEEKLQAKSLGLSSIKSRVEFLGGEISIESKPGAGIMVFIQIPLVKS